MGSVHQISTGKKLDTSETLSEEARLQRTYDFLMGEINRLSAYEVERNWGVYYFAMERLDSFPDFQRKTEEQKEIAGRVDDFLEQERIITGGDIDKPLYNQYFRYLKGVHILGIRDNGFQAWKIDDDRPVNTKAEENRGSLQAVMNTPEPQGDDTEGRPLTELQIAKMEMQKAFGINPFEEVVSSTPEPIQEDKTIPEIQPEPEAIQHPATNLFQQLRESQPEPQRQRFRDRLMQWFKSW